MTEIDDQCLGDGLHRLYDELLIACGKTDKKTWKVSKGLVHYGRSSRMANR